MNAVNLIPADRRTRRGVLSVSPPMLAVVGVLVLALVGAILYVSASNRVSARRTQLAQVKASAAAWNAAASRYGASVQEAQNRAKELGDIRQLIVGRFPWSELLGQVGALMPAKSELGSMQASTSPGSSAGAAPIPSVTLSGCAASQSTVAKTMVQLHRITDVTNVSLASSADSGSSGASGQNGGCAYPVQFSISLTFRSAAASSSTAASRAGTTPASSTSTGTGSAASASVSTSSGAAQ